MIEAAGFSEVQIGQPVDVFEGASGEGNARAFDTYGYTFRAVKLREVERSPVPVACELDHTQPGRVG